MSTLCCGAHTFDQDNLDLNSIGSMAQQSQI
jgi:hypothetical protein